MSDLSMADQLYHYIAGGHKMPLVSEILLRIFTQI